MNAVGADHGRDARAGPVLERELTPSCPAPNRPPLAEMDGSLRKRALERGQQVGPVHRELRRAISSLGGAAHSSREVSASTVPGTADPMRRAVRRIADLLAEAQPVNDLDGIGREIDGGADALELRSLARTRRRQSRYARSAFAAVSPPMPAPITATLVGRAGSV